MTRSFYLYGTLHSAMVLVTTAFVLLAGAAFAQTPEASETPVDKLTVGYYQMRGGDWAAANGRDINVRRNTETGHVWLGLYSQPAAQASKSSESAQEKQLQWRTGWDATLGSTWRLQPSVQLASGGFVGGSLGLETGEVLYAGAGQGRTNLRPYVNLNFDPNDARMLWIGLRSSTLNLSLQRVRDNRENPDQEHTHVLLKVDAPNKQRFSIDVLRKRGLVQDIAIQRWGWSATAEHSGYFVRLAHDPLVNFTPQDMWRLSVGRHF